MRISDWSSDVCSSDLPHHPCKGDCAMRNTRHAIAATALLAGCLLGGGAALAQGGPPMGRGSATMPMMPGYGYGANSGYGYGMMQGYGKIGRASCRERVCPLVSILVVAVFFKKKNSMIKRKK